MTRYSAALLLLWALTSPLFAQPVDIPDANLRAAIIQALGGAPVTRDTMLQLTELDARKRGVIDLTGLQYAHNLKKLTLVYNNITDLGPISELRLNSLWLWDNQVSDLSPLAGMRSLTYLDLGHNHISDLSPLGELTNLVWLELQGNLITDVTPLAGLTNLESLWITGNAITDHSSLDGLSLEVFEYDQICDMPPLPLQPRLERSFPSIFTAWGGLGWSSVLNQPHLSDLEQMAQHDLYFCCLIFGGEFVETENGMVIRSYQEEAIQGRDDYIAQNPNMTFLAGIDMALEELGIFPDDSPYWLRDEDGNIIRKYEAGWVDLSHPDIQKRSIQKALAVSKCGLYDGIFMDIWNELYRNPPSNLEGIVTILKSIRERVHPDFLIMVNSSNQRDPDSAPYLNGLFMESGVPGKWENPSAGFTVLENNLSWAEANLRTPVINALETDVLRHEPLDSPTNLRYMRAATTLSLTFSDGYVLFRIDSWEGKHMHWHYWYDFWDADLGRPVGPKFQLYDDDIPGLYIREFTNGWTVYNHSGAEQTIMLPELTTGVASHLEGQSHTLPNLDGEMYLRVKPANPADVNGDGVVNILDLTIIARELGTDNLEGDVNGDGVVNILDLVEVAAALEGGGAAPSADSPDLSNISAADVEKWLALAQGLDLGDANFQRRIHFLEGLLAALTPKETTLLPNYPNPFNPETWIPYRLARGTEVAITIYDTKGALVRRLSLGNQAAGHYAERGKAAHWDGRNEDGEAVASGIYIYQFRAGDYAASRRMVIVK